MDNDPIERVAHLFAQAAERYRRIQETSVLMKDGTTVYGSEMHMAVAIGEGRSRTATELGEIFGVTRGAVSQAVNRLEAKGIIKREPSPEDSKKLIIALTEKGRDLEAMHSRLHGGNEAAIEAAAAAFGREKLAIVEEFLSAIGSLMDGLIGRNKEPER